MGHDACLDASIPVWRSSANTMLQHACLLCGDSLAPEYSHLDKDSTFKTFCNLFDYRPEGCLVDESIFDSEAFMFCPNCHVLIKEAHETYREFDRISNRISVYKYEVRERISRAFREAGVGDGGSLSLSALVRKIILQRYQLVVKRLQSASQHHNALFEKRQIHVSSYSSQVKSKWLIGNQDQATIRTISDSNKSLIEHQETKANLIHDKRKSLIQNQEETVTFIQEKGESLIENLNQEKIATLVQHDAGKSLIQNQDETSLTLINDDDNSDSLIESQDEGEILLINDDQEKTLFLNQVETVVRFVNDKGKSPIKSHKITTPRLINDKRKSLMKNQKEIVSDKKTPLFRSQGKTVITVIVSEGKKSPHDNQDKTAISRIVSDKRKSLLDNQAKTAISDKRKSLLDNQAKTQKGVIISDKRTSPEQAPLVENPEKSSVRFIDDKDNSESLICNQDKSAITLVDDKCESLTLVDDDDKCESLTLVDDKCESLTENQEETATALIIINDKQEAEDQTLSPSTNYYDESEPIDFIDETQDPNWVPEKGEGNDGGTRDKNSKSDKRRKSDKNSKSDKRRKSDKNRKSDKRRKSDKEGKSEEEVKTDNEDKIHKEDKSDKSVANKKRKFGEFYCEICGALFNYNADRFVHMRTHIAPIDLTCTECAETFENSRRLKIHYREEHGEEMTHVCAECGKECKNQYELTLHEVSHTDERPFACCQCDKRFKLKTYLKRHEALHMMRRNAESAKYKCPLCAKVFFSKGNLETHQESHSSERPFPCPRDDCDKRFVSQLRVKVHLRVAHVTERPFACPQCDKTFKYKDALTSHAVTHLTDRPFLCSLCGQAFKTPLHLRRHAKAHMEELPFACPVCPKAFKTPYRLKIHARLHTGERPFVCQHCFKGFRIREGLRNHSKRGCSPIKGKNK